MTHPQVLDPAGAAMRGRCPRCGEGNLFAGYLKLQPKCSACGLDYAFADSGDGPAFFVMSITGLVAVVVLALLVFGLGMVPGLALLLAIVVAGGLGGWLLRPAKGLLIGLQYKNDASEGRQA